GPPPPGSVLFPYTTLFRSAEGVRAGEVDLVSAVPEQALLSVREIKRDIDAARFERQWHFIRLHRDLLLAVLDGLNLLCDLDRGRSEEHTSELQSLAYLVCR